jgi:quercetin dioxygenase-like cupin family protein
MTPAGKSVFVSDGDVQPITLAMSPGADQYRIWGIDGAVHLPSDGSPPPEHDFFPPVEGFRFGFFTVPPAGMQAPADLDMAAALVEAKEKLPGALEFMEAENPGMHTTDTVDYIVVLSGEVALELDDGQSVQLRTGDCVVQNGTRHAWRNTSREPCFMAYAIVGARRR